MKSDVPKQYLSLKGKPVLYYALKAFEDSFIDEIVLVTGVGQEDYCQKEIVEHYGFQKVSHVIAGGKERYDSIMELLSMRDPDGDIPADTTWKALQAAAQDPSPNDVTSNTQWSLVYDDTDLTAQIVIRRKWGDVIHYDLNTNEIDG